MAQMTQKTQMTQMAHRNKGFFRYKSKEKGLTGGAIAGIVVSCVVVVGIVLALMYCFKSGKFSQSQVTPPHQHYESSTINELNTSKI